MQTTRDNERQQAQQQAQQQSQQQQQAQQSAGGGSGGAQQAVDSTQQSAPAPTKQQIESLLKAGLPGYDEASKALATKLAAETTSQAGVDGLMANNSELYSQAIVAWRKAAGGDQGFVKAFNKDPIATQKIADIEAEQYYEGNIVAAQKKFFAAVADALQQTKTDRSRLYPVLRDKAGPFKFKGTPVPEDKLSKMSRRTHGVGSLHKWTLSAAGKTLISDFMAAEVASSGPPGTPRQAPDPADITGGPGLQAMKRMLRTSHASDARPFADPSGSLARAETWYSPAEVAVHQADPDLAFADMMTVGALQPEWYADGAIDLTIEPKGVREARKPTAFDGLMSALWLARNQDGQTYGVTGGGAREFLETGVTWAEAKSAVPVIPSDAWSDELNKMSAAVGGDSSVGEELLRGNDPGVNQTQGAYEQVLGTSMQEAQSPSTVAGQPAPGPGSPAVAGGTFDTSRTPPPLYSTPPGGGGSAGGGGAGPTPPPSAGAGSASGGATGATPSASAAQSPAPQSPAPQSPAPQSPAAQAPAPQPPAPQPSPATPSPTEAQSAQPEPESDPGVRNSESSGTAATRAPAGATESTPAAAAPPAADAQSDVSKHADGPPPGGWQGRVVQRVPSESVRPDDPGHTYHVLDDGDVVSTSKPRSLSADATRSLHQKYPDNYSKKAIGAYKKQQAYGDASAAHSKAKKQFDVAVKALNKVQRVANSSPVLDAVGEFAAEQIVGQLGPLGDAILDAKDAIELAQTALNTIQGSGQAGDLADAGMTIVGKIASEVPILSTMIDALSASLTAARGLQQKQEAQAKIGALQTRVKKMTGELDKLAFELRYVEQNGIGLLVDTKA
ncbi:MAG: hypothetical protein CMH53_04655 [Myxococcales bacterium]|nr:hypothetical protein [Myxococcales bacterium]